MDESGITVIPYLSISSADNSVVESVTILKFGILILLKYSHISLSIADFRGKVTQLSL